MNGGHSGCVYLLSQILATFCTQTLHDYWMAAFFDSDDDTPGKKQQKSIIEVQCLNDGNKPNINFRIEIVTFH